LIYVSHTTYIIHYCLVSLCRLAANILLLLILRCIHSSSVWQRWKRRKGRQGRKGPDQQEGPAIKKFQSRSSVSRWSCPPFLEELCSPGPSGGSYRRCIHFGYFGISHRRSSGVGRKRLQGSQSQAYHTASLAISHSR
jgi:hypothetical protein